ncbi:Cnd3 domain-containing protein [Trichostrongylus colubriformis]|uniref:Cnd3 domain-containing protein n=1 Tax=Trichostrongylus colubriformis TaxID=6319 RepID=A0AAN8IJF8_TRICO
MTRRKPRKPDHAAEEGRPSRSASPELGYQSDTNCEPEAVATVKTSMTVKKRGARITITSDQTNIIAYLEEKIADTFERAFNTICEASGSKYCSDILQAAYNKVEEQQESTRKQLKEIFFEKFLHRLSFMVESTVSLDNRRKVFRFISKFSVNQWKRGVPEFIDCLVEFCETLSCCDNVAVRQNVCTLVGFLLKEEGCTGDGVEENAVPVHVKRKLYCILLERQLDKVIAVRAEVIQSVADIQDDEIPNDFIEALGRSPKDIILMGLRDIAADCRLTAAFALRVVTDSHADYLIELASCDGNSKVRVAAIRQLSRLPLTFLSEQQRMELLRGVVFSDEASVVDAVFSLLIPAWLSFIHKVQERKNKKRNSGEHVTEGESATEIKEELDSAGDLSISNGIQRKKCDHGLGAAAQGLLAMIDFCDDPEADVLARATLFFVFDVIRHKLHLNRSSLTYFVSSLVNDNTFPEILSTHNYTNLMDKSLSSTDQAQYAFFWRVLIEYCCERAESECERLECMHVLAPPLSAMCELILEFQSRSKKLPENLEERRNFFPAFDIHQIGILHLLAVLRHLDRRNAVEVSEWKCVLLHLLRDETLSKEVTDCVMSSLAQEFFDGNPEHFLVNICDVIAETMRSSNFDKCDENSEPQLSSKPELAKTIKMHQPTDHVMRVCMQLTHSMLRTGVFTKYGPLLKKLFDDIIAACLSSKNSRVSIWALEAAGILAIMEETLAKDIFLRAQEGLKNDDEKLQVSATDVLTDLIAVYGFNEIASWQRERLGEMEAESNPQFVNFLLDAVENKCSGPELCLKACECAAKILLLESLSDEEFSAAELITALIARLFHSSSSRLPGVKSCLEKFFAIFSSVRRKNQLAMMAAFHLLMSQVRTATDDDFVLHIDIVAALDLIVGATQFRLLKNAPDRAQGSVQPVFLRELLNYQKDHPDDICASLYWQTATALDLDEFEASELLEAQRTVQVILDDAIATSSLRSKVVVDIQKFMRCIENAFHTIANRDAEDAERGDCLTELRVKVPRTPGRGRRRTPKSTTNTPIRSARTTTTRKKATTSVKRSTQQVLAGECTPSPPPVVSSLVTPVARTRPLLTRSAKVAAVSKTRRWLFEKEDE